MGNNAKSKKEEALLYHSEGRPGKIEVVPTKPYSTQKDLSLAYSPGVAEPCLAIERDCAFFYARLSKSKFLLEQEETLHNQDHEVSNSMISQCYF